MPHNFAGVYMNVVVVICTKTTWTLAKVILQINANSNNYAVIFESLFEHTIRIQKFAVVVVIHIFGQIEPKHNMNISLMECQTFF